MDKVLYVNSHTREDIVDKGLVDFANGVEYSHLVIGNPQSIARKMLLSDAMPRRQKEYTAVFNNTNAPGMIPFLKKCPNLKGLGIDEYEEGDRTVKDICDFVKQRHSFDFFYYLIPPTLDEATLKKTIRRFFDAAKTNRPLKGLELKLSNPDYILIIRRWGPAEGRLTHIGFNSFYLPFEDYSANSTIVTDSLLIVSNLKRMTGPAFVAYIQSIERPALNFIFDPFNIASGYVSGDLNLFVSENLIVQRVKDISFFSKDYRGLALITGLRINECGVTNELIPLLRRSCPNITRLDLSDNPALTTVDLSVLPFILQELKLSRCSITSIHGKPPITFSRLFIDSNPIETLNPSCLIGLLYLYIYNTPLQKEFKPLLEEEIDFSEAQGRAYANEFMAQYLYLMAKAIAREIIVNKI